MNHSFSWMRGDFDPVKIEIYLLKSKLSEAYRSDNRVQATLILRNLHDLGYKATG